MGCCSDDLQGEEVGRHEMHRMHGGGRQRVRMVKHECGCGGGGQHGGRHGGHHSPMGFQRRFESRAEQSAELEAYLAQLRAEVVAVEEKLAELQR